MYMVPNMGLEVAKLDFRKYNGMDDYCLTRMNYF